MKNSNPVSGSVVQMQFELGQLGAMTTALSSLQDLIALWEEPFPNPQPDSPLTEIVLFFLLSY